MQPIVHDQIQTATEIAQDAAQCFRIRLVGFPIGLDSIAQSPIGNVFPEIFAVCPVLQVRPAIFSGRRR